MADEVLFTTQHLVGQSLPKYRKRDCRQHQSADDDLKRRRLLPSGSTMTGMIKNQALMVVCSTSAGTTLHLVQLNNHANNTDDAIRLNANQPNGKWLCRVPAL